LISYNDARSKTQQQRSVATPRITKHNNIIMKYWNLPKEQRAESGTPVALSEKTNTMNIITFLSSSRTARMKQDPAECLSFDAYDDWLLRKGNARSTQLINT
jgi:hypothetical protein